MTIIQMKGKVHIAVDNSNFLLTGRRLSGALVRGGCEVFDQGWSYDLIKLTGLFRGCSIGSKTLSASYVHGGRPVFAEVASRCGFRVLLRKRCLGRGEKGVDMALGVDLVDRALDWKVGCDRVALFTGDSDFVPVVKVLERRGIPVELWSFSCASRELRDVASKFVCLDGHLNEMRLDLPTPSVSSWHPHLGRPPAPSKPPTPTRSSWGGPDIGWTSPLNSPH